MSKVPNLLISSIEIVKSNCFRLGVTSTEPSGYSTSTSSTVKAEEHYCEKALTITFNPWRARVWSVAVLSINTFLVCLEIFVLSLLIKGGTLNIVLAASTITG